MKKGSMFNALKKVSALALAAVLTLGTGLLAGCNQQEDVLEEIKKKGSLTMATSPDFPPFEFYVLDKDGKKQIVGSDIALGQAIADKIGVELDIKVSDFKGVLANVQGGQADMAISGFAKTEERMQAMQFSEGYQRSSSNGFQGLLTTKEKAATDAFKDLNSIKEAKLNIGAQAASIQYEMAGKLTDQANIKQLGTMEALALALNAGDLDAVVVSTDSAEPMLETFPDFVILPQDGFDLDPENMYSTNVIGFPLGEEYQSLIDLANEVIKEARKSGDLEKWNNEAKALIGQAVE
jgi:ABC-type amino acid transport substrate-binding protein